MSFDIMKQGQFVVLIGLGSAFLISTFFHWLGWALGLLFLLAAAWLWYTNRSKHVKKTRTKQDY